MAQDPTTGVWGISAQGLSHCCMECDELVDVVYRDFPRPGQVRGCHALRDNVPFHLGGWLSERRWLVVMMAIFAWCITSFLLRLVEMWYVKK
jgi:hypothetical protein